MEQIHCFSDFADTGPAMDGKKKRISEILNRPIIVRAYKILASKQNIGKQCLHLQFEMDDELCVLFTGSAVLADQCAKHCDKVPFRAQVKQIDKYFTLA